MKNVICIKASSHTNFELYLIGEKYEIPYNFLIKYKEDKTVNKFWTEVGSGKIMAIEEVVGSKKKFVTILPLTPSEEKKVKDINPIPTGKVITKWKGDIESKELEFKQMIEETEKRRIEMLSRKYDPSNIVCINSLLTDEQLFAICLNNDLDFVEVVDFIHSNYHININRVWFEKKTSILVAYECDDNYFDINEDALIPRDAISKMSRKPIKTPKIKITEENVEEYFRVKSYGFDLDIPKFEKHVVDADQLVDDDIDLDKFSINDLENLLQIAVDDEDYESAAELRDAINSIKKIKK